MPYISGTATRESNLPPNWKDMSPREQYEWDMANLVGRPIGAPPQMAPSPSMAGNPSEGLVDITGQRGGGDVSYPPNLPLISQPVTFNGGGIPKLDLSGLTDPSVQKTTTVPWEAQQPYLKDLFAEAYRLYSQPGTTYPEPSWQSEQALARQYSEAMNNPYLSGMQTGITQGMGYQNPTIGAYQRMQGSYQDPTDLNRLFSRSSMGQLNVAPYTGINPAISGIGSAISRAGSDPYTQMALEAAGRPNVGTQYLQGLTGGLQDTQTQDILRGMTAGGPNPYLEQMLGSASRQLGTEFDKTTGKIKGAFSGAGRYGSGAMREALSGEGEKSRQALADFATNLYGTAYGQDQARRLQAAGLLGDVTGAGMGRQLQLGGTLGSQYGSDLDRLMSAAGMGTSAYQTGTGQMLSGLGTQGSLYGESMGRGLTGEGMRQAAYGADTGTLAQGLGMQSDIYGRGMDFNRGILGDLSGVYGEDMRTRLSATGMIPQMNQMNLQDIASQRDVGTYYDTLAGQRAMEPWTRLGLYGGAVQGNYGGTTTSPGPSQLDRILGFGADLGTMYLPFAPRTPAKV